MKKVSDLVSAYYARRIRDENLFESAVTPDVVLPIKPERKSEWVMKRDPIRLCRTYEVDEENYNDFVADILDLQMDMQHHAKIILEFPEVRIEVWTHDLRDVTELDKKWAKQAEQIWRGYKQ